MDINDEAKLFDQTGIQPQRVLTEKPRESWKAQNEAPQSLIPKNIISYVTMIVGKFYISTNK